MKPTQARVVVTGASGGIGRALAAQLHRRGAAVMLVGRDMEALRQAIRSIAGSTERLACQAADVTTADGRRDVVDRAVAWRCNVLVNNAGIGEFGFVDEQTDAALERLFAINALAPMQLTRALLPHLHRQPEAAILNVGSVFGSLAYPGFAAYSASKFALRGFTEAMRRECADGPVRFHYVAPRAARTALNSEAVCAMNEALGVRMDPPEVAAEAVARALEQDRAEAYLGWPEKLFVRINSVLPRLVDAALRKQLSVIRHHALNPDLK